MATTYREGATVWVTSPYSGTRVPAIMCRTFELWGGTRHFVAYDDSGYQWNVPTERVSRRVVRDLTAASEGK